jgi:hypothetical protein
LLINYVSVEIRKYGANPYSIILDTIMYRKIMNIITLVKNRESSSGEFRGGRWGRTPFLGEKFFDFFQQNERKMKK